jgi:hypothetical protein
MAKKVPQHQAGERFGRLTVTSRIPPERKMETRYVCQCDCGTETTVNGARLRNGDTKSCGCLSREVTSAIRKTHGMKGTPEYNAYQGAKTRCISRADGSYERYGGRGIEFRFDSFEDFYSEVGTRPSAKHSLDRIDVDGHYEPGNIRWATDSIQAINQRLRSSNTSGYRGVYRHGNGWVASIHVSGRRRLYLGQFSTPELAGMAFDTAALEFRGADARLNFPPKKLAEREPMSMTGVQTYAARS